VSVRDEALRGAGFVVRRRGGHVLVATPDAGDELVALGFDGPAAWESCIGGDAIPGGRGGSGLVRLGDGAVLRCKRLRRGGLLAALWRDRFVGRSRLVANATAPGEVARRGIRTPLAEALLVVAGPPGFFRGWLATRNLAGAADLVEAARRDGPPDRHGWAEVLGFVRAMHDAGVEHRDLNARNLVWTPEGLTVVDLDGVRLHPGPLPFALRRRALRRLDRSWVKELGDGGHAERLALWHELYAGDSEAMSRRLADGAAADREVTRIHRLRDG
jgi:3-deoxy-D-manno-octulosonic acid kinase